MKHYTVAVAEVLEDVAVERVRQQEKWGKQRHSWPEWIAILGEEFGEASRAVVDLHWCHEGASIESLREELVHVAAVAVQIIEHIDEAQP